MSALALLSLLLVHMVAAEDACAHRSPVATEALGRPRSPPAEDMVLLQVEQKAEDATLKAKGEEDATKTAKDVLLGAGKFVAKLLKAKGEEQKTKKEARLTEWDAVEQQVEMESKEKGEKEEKQEKAPRKRQAERRPSLAGDALTKSTHQLWKMPTAKEMALASATKVKLGITECEEHQGHYRRWCDIALDWTVMEDAIEDRPNWCLKAPTPEVNFDEDFECYSADVAEFCRAGYEDCVATVEKKKEYVDKCCVQAFALRPTEPPSQSSVYPLSGVPCTPVADLEQQAHTWDLPQPLEQDLEKAIPQAPPEVQIKIKNLIKSR